MEAFFPKILITYLAVFRQGFSQPNYRLLCGYIASLMLTTGRKTTGNIAKTVFWVNRSVSSWERFLSQAIWDSEFVIDKLISLVVSQLGDRLLYANHYLIPLDSTLVVKRAKKMLGIQKWSQSKKSQIGHHWMIGGLLVAMQQRFIALPLVSRLICGRLSRSAFAVSASGETHPMGIFSVALAVVKSITQRLHLAPPLVVADAYFSKAPFINALIEKGIGLVTRLRNDAVGFWEIGHNRRTKLAGWLDKFPRQRANVTIYGKKRSISFVSGDLFLRHVSRKVRVVVIATAKQPLILMTTAGSLTPMQLVEIYAARFTIELTIRDLKQHLGLAQYQSTTTLAFCRFLQLVCCANTLGQLMMLATQWGISSKGRSTPQSFSWVGFRASLRGYVVQQLMAGKFASDADLPPSQDDIDPILRLVA